MFIEIDNCIFCGVEVNVYLKFVLVFDCLLLEVLVVEVLLFIFLFEVVILFFVVMFLWVLC